jgi:ribosomal protein S25
MDNAVYDRIIGEISKIGKLISVSTVLKRFKVNGSIVYGLIKDLNKSDQL